MKAIKKSLIMFMALTAMCVCATSCSSSDEEVVPSVTVNGASYTLSLSPTEDHLTVFDIKVSYTNASGTTVQENVTTTPWSKTVEYTTFPVNYAVSVTQTLKTGVTYAKERYTLGAVPQFNVYATYSTGGYAYVDTGYLVTSTKGISVSDLEAYASENATVCSFSGSMTLNDNKTEVTGTLNKLSE